MNLHDAKNEFAARLYLWAKEDIKREVGAGYPLLRQFETGGAFHFLNHVQSLSAEDSVALMTARLRRSMKEAAASFGEASSAHEMELMEEFSEHSILRSPMEEDLLGRQLEGEDGLFADRKTLRTAIRAELKPILGEKITKFGEATWTYLTPVCNWTVQTNIDTGGRSQLSYSHNIGSPFHPFLYEPRISALFWLGVGQAQWSFLIPSDVDKTAKFLADVCSHFLQVAPKLLVGIAPATAISAA